MPIALTDEQIDDLMENPHSPEDEELWFDCIIKIDTTKEKEFLTLSNCHGFDLYLCISKESGLYWIDAFDCLEDVQEGQPMQIKQNSPLRKMLDRGLIQKVFRKNIFDIDDKWNGNEFVHTKKFKTAPYFIFHQPYSNSFLPKCVSIPERPVKIDQIRESLRHRVFQIPISFREKESFQIAEWYPCSSMYNDGETQYIDGNEYRLLPMSDGTVAYFNTEIVVPSCFQVLFGERKIWM